MIETRDLIRRTRDMLVGVAPLPWFQGWDEQEEAETSEVWDGKGEFFTDTDDTEASEVIVAVANSFEALYYEIALWASAWKRIRQSHTDYTLGEFEVAEKRLLSLATDARWEDVVEWAKRRKESGQ